MSKETLSQPPIRIEKPWLVHLSCIYDPENVPFTIGRVVIESDNFLSVQRYERQGQRFFNTWHPESVERFPNYSETIEFYLNSRGDTSARGELTEKVLMDFPIAAKHDCLQTMHDVLYVYSQRQPKCTESKKTKPRLPNLYECFRQVNPKRAAEIDEEFKKIFEE
jgi:hypothetical protein